MNAITLPSGKRVSVPAYVKAWKTILAEPDETTEYKGWFWFPARGEDILRSIHTGIHDRINRHLPWKVAGCLPDKHGGRVRVKLVTLHQRGLLACDCRWCGRALSRYENPGTRFCDALCRNAYNT